MKRCLFLASATFVALAMFVGTASAATVEVRMKDGAFNPKVVSAKPGDTLVFHNDDIQLHSVLLPDAEKLLSERFIEPGETFSVAIPKDADPRLYNLVCTIHVDMTGTIQILTN